MQDKKQLVKRFLHDNAVILGTILLFVVILGILIFARYGSLYSIRNIENLNPLITSDSAELVAVNVNGVIKIIKDEDGVVVEGGTSASDVPKPTTTSKPTGNNGGSSSSGSGSNGSSGGGISSPSPSPSSTPSSSPSPSPSPSPNVPFRVEILSLASLGIKIYDNGWLGCKNDRIVRVTMQITSGSGIGKTQWELNGKVVKVLDPVYVTAGEIKATDLLITTEGAGGYFATNHSVTAKIINTGNSTTMATRTLSFEQDC